MRKIKKLEKMLDVISRNCRCQKRLGLLSYNILTAVYHCVNRKKKIAQRRLFSYLFNLFYQ